MWVVQDILEQLKWPDWLNNLHFPTTSSALYLHGLYIWAILLWQVHSVLFKCRITLVWTIWSLSWQIRQMGYHPFHGNLAMVIPAPQPLLTIDTQQQGHILSPPPFSKTQEVRVRQPNKLRFTMHRMWTSTSMLQVNTALPKMKYVW